MTRRRYRLRLVSRELDGKPRHRVAWEIDGNHYATEIWTEAEYAALLDGEKPYAAFLPGVGYVALVTSDERMGKEIAEERDAAVAEWELARGLSEVRW